MPSPEAESYVRNAARFEIPLADVTLAVPAAQIFDFPQPAAPLSTTIAAAPSTLLRWSLRKSLVQVIAGSRNLISLQSARADLLLAGVVVDSTPVMTSGITALAHGQQLTTQPREVQLDDFRNIAQPSGAAPNWQLQLTLEVNNTDAVNPHNLTVTGTVFELELFELTQRQYPRL